jgi:hypothetical protein
MAVIDKCNSKWNSIHWFHVPETCINDFYVYMDIFSHYFLGTNISHHHYKCLFLNNFGRHLENSDHVEKNNIRIEFPMTNYRGIHVSHEHDEAVACVGQILRELWYVMMFDALLIIFWRPYYKMAVTLWSQITFHLKAHVFSYQTRPYLVWYV